jgi:hypothetical protein
VMNWSPVAPLAPASGATYEVVAAQAGPTTITATYTDPSGHVQASIIPVSVTA